jgi:hypothetical protein
VVIGPYTAYRKEDTGWCVPVKNVLLFVRDWPTLEAVLKRDGEPRLAADVREAVQGVDWSRSSVLLWSNHTNPLKPGADMPNHSNVLKVIPSAVLHVLEGETQVHEIHWEDAITSRTTVYMRGQPVEVWRRAEVQQFIKETGRAPNVPPFRDVISRIKITEDGRRMVAETSVRSDEIVKWFTPDAK